LSASFQVIFRGSYKATCILGIGDCDTCDMPTFTKEAVPPSIVICF
jgi:hypothetical protein